MATATAPPANPPPGPNHTLYIKNLNERVRKTDLKKALYCIFSEHGPILEISALKTQKLRGQAFIIFREATAAINAQRALHNTIFFGKAMVVQFAKAKSDIVAKMEGSFVPREKPPREAQPKKKRKERSGKGDDGDEPPAKREKKDKSSSNRRHNMPNKTLFIQNLPEDCTDGVLIGLFQQYHGFREVRLVPGKKGWAFVEFQNENFSAIALQELQGYQVDNEHAMIISFQKRNA